MRYFFVILCTAFIFNLSGQTAKIRTQISKLDNSQFQVDHSDKAKFSVKSSAAQKLMRIGKPATEQLITALDDDQRNIMAQYVLCHIWFKMATFAGPKEFSEDGESVYKYFLGQEKGEGMVITETGKEGNYKLSVSRRSIEKIKIYWKAKAGIN